jgi:hypothetical protein
LLQRVAPRENASGAHDDPEGMGDGGGRVAGRGSAGAGRSINDPDRGADLPQYPSPARLRFRKGPFDGPAGAYEDRVAHYVTSEVALDYAASTVLLLAALAPPPP